MEISVIKVGDTGPVVESWQNFLLGQHLYEGAVDGDFGPATKDATVAFQQLSGLQPDGVAGNKTFGAAQLKGFVMVTDNRPGKEGASWPAKPVNLHSINGNQQRQILYGPMDFVAAPEAGNPEHIRITNNWEATNLVNVSIPQLSGVLRNPVIRFHRKGQQQLQDLWRAWESADLLHLVLSWEGSFEPRFQRGSRAVLSNHSFGTAFDINEEWNKFHTLPALVGQKGSVRELVPIANQCGFYWGGHFSNPDGMHFELGEASYSET